MKSPAASLLVAGILAVAASAFFGWQQLPEKMASHFNAAGVADGWMDRTPFVVSMLAFGLLVPAFVVAVLYSARFLPPQVINLPNKTFWGRPENHQRACEILFRSALLFAGGFLLWEATFLQLIVKANKAHPPTLEPSQVFPLTAILLAFTVGWLVMLITRFVRTGPPAETLN